MNQTLPLAEYGLDSGRLLGWKVVALLIERFFKQPALRISHGINTDFHEISIWV